MIDGIGGQVKAVETWVTIIIQHKHEKYTVRTRAKIVLDETRENFPVIIGRLDFFNFIAGKSPSERWGMKGDRFIYK